MKTLKTHFPRSSSTKVVAKPESLRRRCDLCRESFKPQFKFQRFCRRCRTQNESFLFHEWLPRLPESLSVA
jgi:hypothetical protein